MLSSLLICNLHTFLHILCNKLYILKHGLPHWWFLQLRLDLSSFHMMPAYNLTTGYISQRLCSYIFVSDNIHIATHSISRNALGSRYSKCCLQPLYIPLCRSCRETRPLAVRLSAASLSGHGRWKLVLEDSQWIEWSSVEFHWSIFGPMWVSLAGRELLNDWCISRRH